MITSGAVNTDLIEQFKNTMQQRDDVDGVWRQHGRSVHLKVHKDADGNVPRPHRDLGDIVDGHVITDDYAVTALAGSGHAPGDKYTHALAVSPLCGECGEAPQKGLDDDDDRCADCAFGDNLLTVSPGETCIVEAVDVEGVYHEEGDRIEATADDDGILRGPDDGVFNKGRYKVVDVVDDGGDA